jgi:DNA-binding beta-propeller fold protein YncE
MVQSADGRLFLITNHKQNNILVFDTQGKVLDAWTLGMGAGHGLTLHREADGTEYLYLTDNSGRIAKTTLAGKVVLELPHAQKCGAYSDKEPYAPTETAVAPNGDIYVADGYGSQFILRFDKTGKYLSKFGGKSTQPTNPGKFMQAHGVAIDNRGPEPLLVCTERVRNEFNWFTLAGKHVRGVYLPGGQEPKYVDGRLQAMLQDQPVFNNCHDVCVDSRGDLYVCQWASGNVYPYKLHRLA